MSASTKTHRQVYSKVSHLVDHHTGEITSSESTSVTRLPAEPPYIKLYLDDISRLMELTGGQKTLMFELVRKIDYDGFISLNATSRRRLREKLGFRDQTLRNRLNELCKKDILRRLGTNEFEANPHFFARGDWKSICERRETFNLTISYSAEDGRVIHTDSGEREP